MATPNDRSGPSLGRHSAALDALRRSVLDGPGSVAPEVRHRIYSGEPVDPPLDAFLERVRSDPTSLGLADIESLTKAGVSEDEIFEAALAAALGAADRVLFAGLRAVGPG